jgi:hypothetical protein
LSDLSIGIQRTDCFTHWFNRSCRKLFSSAGFCFADSQAAFTLSIPIVIPRERLAFSKTLGQSNHPFLLCHKSRGKKLDMSFATKEYPAPFDALHSRWEGDEWKF